jgi:hypothetical protein
LDQAVQAESAQLIGHTALGELVLRSAAQGGQIDSQVSVGEPGRQQIEKQQRIPDCLHHWVGEAESRRSLPVQQAGPIELLEGFFSENADLPNLMLLSVVWTPWRTEKTSVRT